MATDTYNPTLVKFAQGSIDWVNDSIRVALVSDNITYSPDIDNEKFVSDVLDGVTAEEFDGTGYGRQDLTGRSVVQDDTNDRARLDCDDTTVFPSIDGDTVQGALVYKEVGGDTSTPGNDPLIAYYTGGDYPQQAGGGDFTVEWNNAYIFALNN